MKKLYALLLALALCLSLAACGGANTVAKSAPSAEDAEEEVEETAAATGEDAEDAGESAEDAGDSAEDAGDSAEDAGDSAEDAGDSAEDAGESAEDADVTADTATALPELQLVELRKFVSGTEQLLAPGSTSEQTADVMDTSRRIGCFFTSEYDDVRDLDLGKFLAYCAAAQQLQPGKAEDEKEYTAFLAASSFANDPAWASFKTAPLPVLRYTVADIDKLLTEYAGITVADLNNDWKSELVYLEDYDAFYNNTSDFNAAVFSPAKGEKVGEDTVRLYDETDDAHILTLKQAGDSWHVVSFTKK